MGKSKSAFLMIMGLFVASLVTLSRGVFGNILDDVVIKDVAKFFGISGGTLSDAIGLYAIPAFLACLIVYLVFELSVWYLRQIVFVDDPKLPSASLRQMPISEIAEYIYKHSAWSYRNYATLNSWWQVKQFIPDEITEAALRNEVRFRGMLPNSNAIDDINIGYWRIAMISGDHIWDGRNHTGTIMRPNCGGVQMHHLTAPVIDVFRKWPRASFATKWSALIWVALKTRRVPGFTKEA